MIPLRDLNPARRFPIVTILLILLNALVFFYQLMQPIEALDSFIHRFGMVPYELAHGASLAAFGTLITSMFLHGGLVHLGGNMLYLWIFGNNIEDFLGSALFSFFYVVCGVAAGLSQVAMNPGSTVAVVGASGAIAGILGAYLVLFPTAQVESLVLFGFFARLVRIPAVVYLGFWIVLQFLNSLISFDLPNVGGIAWFAHIGGFLAGVLLIIPFRFRGRR